MFNGIFRKKPVQTTEITNVYIRLGGDVHSLGSRSVKHPVFSVEIPFHNRLGNGLLPDNIRGPPVGVSGISVERPFVLLSVSPKPPVNVDYMSKSVFSIKLRAPEGSYSGPLYIRFDTDTASDISIRIESITLRQMDKSYGLEESASAMVVRKAQVFRKDIQLYKILSYGQKVNSIEVSDPFSIEEAKPALPFTIDKKDSYVLELYIRCPDFSYAGPMELTFK